MVLHFHKLMSISIRPNVCNHNFPAHIPTPTNLPKYKAFDYNRVKIACTLPGRIEDCTHIPKRQHLPQIVGDGCLQLLEVELVCKAQHVQDCVLSEQGEAHVT